MRCSIRPAPGQRLRAPLCCVAVALCLALAISREPAPASDAPVTPEAITATGPEVQPNPACVGQSIAATLSKPAAVLPVEVGSGVLVGWNQGPEFSYDWGSFSDSKTTTARGSFPTPGTHTIAVRVTVRGTADYLYRDGAGNVHTEAREVLGRRTFEANVLALPRDALAVVVSAPKMVSVRQRGIPVTAAVVRGGEPVPGLSVAFSSDALALPPFPVVTDARGMATVPADAGPTPSPFRDGSHVTATVHDPASGKATGTARLTLVRIGEPTPANPRTIVGGFPNNDLYSVVLSFTVSPRIPGVPVGFAFAPGEGEGVDFPARLEEPSAATDASGQARVRVRSSDLRESPTVLCRYGASAAGTRITFEGITGVTMVEEKK